MKTRFIVLVSVMAGVALGAAGVQALHAQAKPPAFVVGEIDVKDPAMLDKEYVPNASKAVRDGGGKYLVAGGKSVSFYGEPPKRIRDHGLRQSGEGRSRVQFRRLQAGQGGGDKYATFRIYAVEGVTP
jgi:hypothetical protein